MTDINLTISTTNLNVNGLNTQIKKQSVRVDLKTTTTKFFLKKSQLLTISLVQRI